MHTLGEFRDYLIGHNVKVKEFKGWYVKVGKDIYTMLDSEIYLNTVKMNTKELLNSFNPKKPKAKQVKAVKKVIEVIKTVEVVKKPKKKKSAKKKSAKKKK